MCKVKFIKLAYKNNNYLVYFSGLLNYAKTDADTIPEGSLNANVGRGLARVTNCTLPKRSSSISRMFFVLACLFGAAYNLSSGGGG